MPSFSDINKGDLAVFLTVVCGYALVMMNDARSEAVIAAEHASQRTEQLAGFMSGGSFTDGDHAVRCAYLVEVSK